MHSNKKALVHKGREIFLFWGLHSFRLYFALLKCLSAELNTISYMSEHL